MKNRLGILYCMRFRRKFAALLTMIYQHEQAMNKETSRGRFVGEQAGHICAKYI